MNELEKMQAHIKEIKNMLKEILPEEPISPQEEREIKKIKQELNYQKLNSILMQKEQEKKARQK